MSGRFWKLFSRRSPQVGGELRFTSWALEQLEQRRPGEELAEAKVQALVDALAGVQGRAGAQVFGMEADRIEPEGRAALESRIVAALGEWKRHFEQRKDAVSLLALDGVGKAHGISDLRLSGRAPLRCDPLGTRDGLSAEWQTRLDRLQQAKAGARRLDLGAIHFLGDEERDAPEIVFGAPSPETLYRCALRYEAEAGARFPRELAAFIAIANGISIDGDPVLRPIAEWEEEDRGLCIGCGSYPQGSLILASPAAEAGLLGATVLDLDDDGEELARYRDFAAFADALLGGPG